MNKTLRQGLVCVFCVGLLISMPGCKKKNEDQDMSTSAEEKYELVEERDSVLANTELENINDTKDNQNKPQTDGGGNEYIIDNEPKIKEIKILVSNDVYYYDNLPIDLDRIVNLILETKGELYVSVFDENATYRAYKSLIDKLVEMEISYSEESVSE